MTSADDDRLEPEGRQLPALVGAHTIAEHDHKHPQGDSGEGHGPGDKGDVDQYELHHEHVPLLPGQILTDTIARLRFTVVLVSFFYSGLFFVIGIMAVCLVAPNLITLLDHSSPILLDAARVIISLISIILACLCIVIAFKQRELTGKLATAEVMIDNIRDIALIQMQATRYNLEELTERLKFPQEKNHPSAFDYIELAKKIGPVISLLMAKERSVMTIAVEGLKLFQVLKKSSTNSGLMLESMSHKSDERFDFDGYLAGRRALVEAKLSEYLTDGEPQILWEAMRYSVLSGGKRLRAMLTIACAESIYSGSVVQREAPGLDCVQAIMPLAAAIEMVHAMSLIHDDLPCLDNDDLRRGKPTNHKVFGEALALLAGDGLLMLASEVLIARSDSRIPRQNLLDVALELSRATGPSGMVGGQVKDMQFTGAADSKFDISVVESIHAGKTGALIRFALWAPAKLLGAPHNKCASLVRLGEIIGLAFQITDDLLDVTGDATTLGKTPGKDAASQKATWVRVFGVQGAREKLAQMEAEGEDLIERNSLDNSGAPVLRSLLKYSIHREK